MEHFLGSPAHGGGQLQRFRYGDDKIHISFEQRRSMWFFLPPAEEQAVINDRVRAAMHKLKSLAVIADEARTQHGEMDPTILAQAFRGELVPQDPKDVPASVMLERLVAERAASEAKPAKSAPAKRAKAKR